MLRAGLLIIIIMPSVIIAVVALFDNTITLGDVLAITVPISIAGLVLFTSWAVGRWKRSRYRKGLFEIGFPNQWPVPANSNRIECKTVSAGVSDVLVGIVLGDDHSFQAFDVRFVASNRGGNVDKGIIQVAGVRDQLRNLSFSPLNQQNREEQVMQWGNDNAAGGWDCYYAQPVPIYHKRALYVKVTVDATTPWQGFMGFRSMDRYGKPVISRARFIVESQQVVGKGDPQP